MAKKTVKHAKKPEQVKVFAHEPIEHVKQWLKTAEDMQKPFDVNFNVTNDGFSFSFNFKGVR